MAPLPQNSTDRLWLDYTSIGVPHSAMYRYIGLTDNAKREQVALALATFLKGLLPTTDGITGARYSAQGTDFSNDVVFSPVAGTATGGTWLEDADSAFITLPGRGVATDPPVRLCFFAPMAFSQPWPAKNRYGVGQNALWEAVHDDWVTVALEPISGVQLVNIAGDNVVFKSYLNFRKNGYRQTKQRES